jgi:hypothetical protein
VGLIAVLHAQYCLALDDPQATFGVDWATPTASVQSISPIQADAHAEAPSQPESIEALLSRPRGSEDMFGALTEDDSPDSAAVVSSPEIPRLFAPPEFSAATSRTLPALVRREYHTVGVDSPISTPRASAMPPDPQTDALA